VTHGIQHKASLWHTAFCSCKYEAFNWITNSESQLMAIIDLLDTTACRDKESEMFKLADQIVRDM